MLEDCSSKASRSLTLVTKEYYALQGKGADCPLHRTVSA